MLRNENFKIGIKLLIVIFLLIFIILLFLPSYKYNYYSLDNCKNTFLTIIIYEGFLDRELIFANGIYKSPPKTNYIKINNFSGFDEMFDGLATCDKGVIKINYYEGYFDPEFTSPIITSNRVDDNNEYDSLIHSSGSKKIRLY